MYLDDHILDNICTPLDLNNNTKDTTYAKHKVGKNTMMSCYLDVSFIKSCNYNMAHAIHSLMLVWIMLC